MRRDKREHGKDVRQDIGLALILILLAMGAGHVAQASGIEDFVNTKIKEEFLKMEAEDLRASQQIPQPQRNLQVAPQWPRPLAVRDPLAGNQEPTAPGEQPSGMDPRAGLSRKIDPSDPVEQRIAEEQAYQLYRENYRRAVQREFLRRLHQAGWDTTRNIAEEIKAKEEGRPY